MGGYYPNRTNLLSRFGPPLSNSWIIIIIWFYIALNRIPKKECYWEGAVPNPK